MKTGRDDLDAMVRVASIPADEPTFLLRAQDPCAGDAVRDWAARQKAARAPLAVVEQALRQADAMDAWPRKKALNDDHLSEAQAKQLVYAHGRRVWNLGKIIAEAHAAALTRRIIDRLCDWGAGGARLGEPEIEMAQELRALLDG